MKRRKKEPHRLKGLPGWLASYADMFTLLMAFFVLLFAFSVVDQELFEQFIVGWNPARAEDFMAIGGGGDMLIHIGDGIFPEQPPAPPPGDGGEAEAGDYGYIAEGDAVGDMYNTFRTYFAEHFPGSEYYDGVIPIEVDEGENFLRITFHEGDGMHFNSGQAVLLPPAVDALNILGPLLREFTDLGHGIIVEGHTDNQPINTPMFPSNRFLSGHRASAVVDFLIDNWGIDPRSITSVGLSEYFPVDTNDTAEGRARNRRVEIKVFTAEATGGPLSSWFQIPMN